MGKLRFNITMTLDGYVAGPNQGIENPLGEGGERMHLWMYKTKFFREMQGRPGGETGTNEDVAREMFANVGATIMGRNMFGGYPGDWGDGSWKGWWGDNPPYHMPVFVLTHHAREPLPMLGGTTFFFITDGIESALRQAKEAAGARDVLVAGGAKAAQQYLAAGLLDEMDIHLVPLFLGAGERLFDNLGGLGPKLEQVRTVDGPGVTHLRYRVVKKGASRTEGQQAESASESVKMAAEGTKATPASDREIVVTRVFDAPRELVFEAWTDPAQVVRWFGPHGFTTTIHEMDVRPGGVWRFVMHGPDGTDYDNHVVFDEVVQPERLVYRHGGGEGSDVKEFHVTVTFDEEDDKTRLSLRLVAESPAERDRMVEFGALEGGKQTLERLAEHLRK